MSRLRQPLEEVLRFSHETPDRGKIARYYRQWRDENDLPDRCDNPDCRYHTEPLTWNGDPLKPVLDHVSGNAHNNQPKNLRYLCPNCDAQLETRGGGNIGRVQNLCEGGFDLVDKKTGTRSKNIFAKTATVKIEGHGAAVAIKKDKSADQ